MSLAEELAEKHGITGMLREGGKPGHVRIEGGKIFSDASFVAAINEVIERCKFVCREIGNLHPGSDGWYAAGLCEVYINDLLYNNHPSDEEALAARIRALKSTTP